MLTDKQKFQALMTEFGLAPKEGSRNDGSTFILFEDGQPKVTGYPSVLADFVFNPDDSFREVGLWE